jgi:carboxymethylenebutenolidase
METFLDIKTKDGICDSFIVYPDDQKPHPAVILIMDGFGPRAHLYQMARTISSRGFYVLLPNMFYRVRRAPVIEMKLPLCPEDMPDLFKDHLMPLLNGYNPELGLSDIGAFLDFLSQQPQVLPGKTRLTGYCFGGAMSIRAAARYPDKINAVGSFHAGRLVTDDANSPHLLLDKIKAELYIAHADNDQSMTPEQIACFKTALDQSGIKYEVELYKGAAHSFTMADLPAYNEAAFNRHWKNLFGLLERSLC